MAASAIKICSRKKGKANRPSKLEKILLGYYIRLGPRSQESRVYLGIKSFLSQNCGGMCLHQNLGKRTRELETSRIVPIKE